MVHWINNQYVNCVFFWLEKPDFHNRWSMTYGKGMELLKRPERSDGEIIDNEYLTINPYFNAINLKIPSRRYCFSIDLYINPLNDKI